MPAAEKAIQRSDVVLLILDAVLGVRTKIGLHGSQMTGVLVLYCSINGMPSKTRTRNLPEELLSTCATCYPLSMGTGCVSLSSYRTALSQNIRRNRRSG